LASARKFWRAHIGQPELNQLESLLALAGARAASRVARCYGTIRHDHLLAVRNIARNAPKFNRPARANTAKNYAIDINTFACDDGRATICTHQGNAA